MKGVVFYEYNLKHQIKKHIRDDLIVEEGIPRVTLTRTHAKQRGARSKEKEKRAGRTNMWCLIVVCETVAISLNTVSYSLRMLHADPKELSRFLATSYVMFCLYSGPLI